MKINKKQTGSPYDLRHTCRFSSFNFLIILVLSIVTGCTQCSSAPDPEVLAKIDYTPHVQDDGWKTSTPEEQGVDPMLLARLYYNAMNVESIYGLLVVKNGFIIAEDYYNKGAIWIKNSLQSVTKSFVSALVGIAVQQGHITGINEKMMSFFPELAARIKDERKKQITIRHMLQMRAGYPWEESTPKLFELLYHGFRPSDLIDVPLIKDPGSSFHYSNLTSHLLGVIVARAVKTDLRAFAGEHLFSPLGIDPGKWTQDWEGYYLGHAELHLTARDMAKFGLLYLNDGAYNGAQIVPAAWIAESLEVYSKNAWQYHVGRNFRDIGYGYQWWSVTSGKHTYSLAWGHGGQQIAFLKKLNMVIVVAADPQYGKHGDTSWRHERANLNLVADFITTLPEE
ncbi:MAG: serine hydrolase [Spirochaetales bacterium]|nr:serine hydrolase [Spirochaetales bacterium]